MGASSEPSAGATPDPRSAWRRVTLDGRAGRTATTAEGECDGRRERVGEPAGRADPLLRGEVSYARARGWQRRAAHPDPRRGRPCRVVRAERDAALPILSRLRHRPDLARPV